MRLRRLFLCLISQGLPVGTFEIAVAAQDNAGNITQSSQNVFTSYPRAGEQPDGDPAPDPFEIDNSADADDVALGSSITDRALSLEDAKSVEVSISGLDSDAFGVEVLALTQTEFRGALVGIDGATLVGDETWTLSGGYYDPNYDAETDGPQPYQYAKYVSAGDSPVEAYLNVKDGQIAGTTDIAGYSSRDVDGSDPLDAAVLDLSEQADGSEFVILTRVTDAAVNTAFNDTVTGDGTGPIYLDVTDPDFADVASNWAVSGSGGADADQILSGSDMVDGSDAEVSPTFTIVSTELLSSARLVQLDMLEGYMEPPEGPAAGTIAVNSETDPEDATDASDVILSIGFGTTPQATFVATWTVTYGGAQYTITGAADDGSLTLGDINDWFADALAAAADGDPLFGQSAGDFSFDLVTGMSVSVVVGTDTPMVADWVVPQDAAGSEVFVDLTLSAAAEDNGNQSYTATADATLTHGVWGLELTDVAGNVTAYDLPENWEYGAALDLSSLENNGGLGLVVVDREININDSLRAKLVTEGGQKLNDFTAKSATIELEGLDPDVVEVTVEVRNTVAAGSTDTVVSVSETFTFNGTIWTAAGVGGSVFDDWPDNAPADAATTPVFVFDISGLPVGTFEIAVAAQDNAGNITQSSQNVFTSYPRAGEQPDGDPAPDPFEIDNSADADDVALGSSITDREFGGCEVC